MVLAFPPQFFMSEQAAGGTEFKNRMYYDEQECETISRAHAIFRSVIGALENLVMLLPTLGESAPELADNIHAILELLMRKPEAGCFYNSLRGFTEDAPRFTQGK